MFAAVSVQSSLQFIQNASTDQIFQSPEINSGDFSTNVPTALAFVPFQGDRTDNASASFHYEQTDIGLNEDDANPSFKVGNIATGEANRENVSCSQDQVCGVIIVEWSKIVNKFSVHFEQTFSKSKKAHFDSLPIQWSQEEKVVDGARTKWCIPLILDAILYLLNHYAFDLARRRSFNQHRVLFECIWETILEATNTKLGFPEDSHHSMVNTVQSILHIRNNCMGMITTAEMNFATPQMSFSSSSTSSNDISSLLTLATLHSSVRDNDRLKLSQYTEMLIENIQLQDAFALPSPWHNLEYLSKSILASEPASKSHRKFHRILTTLADHPLWQNRQSDETFLASAFRQVIFHGILYFHNYVPSMKGMLSTSLSHSTYDDRDLPANWRQLMLQNSSIPLVFSYLSEEDQLIFVRTIWPCLASSSSITARSSAMQTTKTSSGGKRTTRVISKEAPVLTKISEGDDEGGSKLFQHMMIQAHPIRESKKLQDNDHNNSSYASLLFSPDSEDGYDKHHYTTYDEDEEDGTAHGVLDVHRSDGRALNYNSVFFRKIYDKDDEEEEVKNGRSCPLPQEESSFKGVAVDWTLPIMNLSTVLRDKNDNVSSFDKPLVTKLSPSTHELKIKPAKRPYHRRQPKLTEKLVATIVPAESFSTPPTSDLNAKPPKIPRKVSNKRKYEKRTEEENTSQGDCQLAESKTNDTKRQRLDNIVAQHVQQQATVDNVGDEASAEKRVQQDETKHEVTNAFIDNSAPFEPMILASQTT